MSTHEFDPEILQDFITESGELLEQLEGDLVHLESTPEDPDLLNQIFRALHTIKGSASFLAMTNLVEIAHVAEGALNTARNGDIVIGSAEMDLLLAAIDVLKIQFDEITSGITDLTKADSQLIESLSVLADGSASATDTNKPCATATDSDADVQQHPDGRTILQLSLDSSKLDLIDLLTSDIGDSLKQIQSNLDQLENPETRASTIDALVEASEELIKTVDFFDISEIMILASQLGLAVGKLDSLSDEIIHQLSPRLAGLCLLLAEQTSHLEQQILISWDTSTILDRIHQLLEGNIHEDAVLDVHADGFAALHTDGIKFGDLPETQSIPTNPTESSLPSIEAPAQTQTTDASNTTKRTAIGQIEQTIRVEVGRLESLMNLVGELVLQKNRIGAIAEDIEKSNVDSELIEQISATTGTLDRVTGDIQMAVMRTRMQPLEKLFGKYPRLIRDLASKTEKKINLVIEGADTEVDKSVIEELGDPLVHLLRNSGDHGIEKPEDRIKAGKDETGTIKLIAGHAGSHVRVQIIDDGKGLDREVIGAKALERGLVTEEQLSTMPDEEVFRFILEAGFSTAAQVSDLSGRGVGMDVVRTNIESKLKGELSIESETGKGTTLTITIPLTVAIMPAMMVAVADEVFAIPLSNITEIVRPEENQISEIGSDPVIHLRGQVYPLISAQEVFDTPETERTSESFVVVISHNQRMIGVQVSSVIGQQEIVIKPLDGVQREGPVSGATIRNDGSVSLIWDITKLMQYTKPTSLKRDYAAIV